MNQSPMKPLERLKAYSLGERIDRLPCACVLPHAPDAKE